MSKKQSVRDLLGLTQEEMAALLKISPGQWSMYESGKRKLPAKADSELTAMLSHVVSEKAKASKEEAVSKAMPEATQKSLKSLLLTNQNRQRLTSEKIARLLKKEEMGKAASHLPGYFENPKEEQPAYVELYVRDIKERATSDQTELLTLQIKLKVLHYEEKLLKEALASSDRIK